MAQLDHGDWRPRSGLPTGCIIFPARTVRLSRTDSGPSFWRPGNTGLIEPPLRGVRGFGRVALSKHTPIATSGKLHYVKCRLLIAMCSPGRARR